MESLKFLLLRPFSPRGSWTPCDRPFLRVCSCPCADVFSEPELSQTFTFQGDSDTWNDSWCSAAPSQFTFLQVFHVLGAWRPGPDGLCFLKVCPAVTCPLQLPFIHVWEKAGMPQVKIWAAHGAKEHHVGIVHIWMSDYEKIPMTYALSFGNLKFTHIWTKYTCALWFWSPLKK